MMSKLVIVNNTQTDPSFYYRIRKRSTTLSAQRPVQPRGGSLALAFSHAVCPSPLLLLVRSCLPYSPLARPYVAASMSTALVRWPAIPRPTVAAGCAR